MRIETRELLKKEFAHIDSLYFNSAYFGPSPYSAKQKVSRALQKELDPSFYDYNVWFGYAERIRKGISDLLDTSPNNIAHSTSVSDINNLIANGFNFSKGDVISAINLDYPSNVLPWMLRAERDSDVTFDLLDLKDQIVPDYDWLKENLSPKTKIFSISWVTFDTGKKIDIVNIGRLMKERDILFIVDATQGFGGLKLSKDELDYIDVLSCASYKWLLGPYGHAWAYFSQKALDRISHKNANWVTSPKSKIVYDLLKYTTETIPGARKFDRGQTSNMLAMSCLDASLELFKEVGLSEIESHNREIRDFFLSNFPKNKYQIITPSDHMGNIVSLKATNVDPMALERDLKFHNVDVSIREGKVRLSFHLFNSVEDVAKLIKALDS